MSGSLARGHPSSSNSIIAATSLLRGFVSFPVSPRRRRHRPFLSPTPPNPVRDQLAAVAVQLGPVAEPEGVVVNGDPALEFVVPSNSATIRFASLAKIGLI